MKAYTVVIISTGDWYEGGRAFYGARAFPTFDAAKSAALERIPDALPVDCFDDFFFGGSPVLCLEGHDWIAYIYEDELYDNETVKVK